MTSARAEAGRSGPPGAGDRSAVPSIRGLPWWAAVLLATVLTAAGTAVDVLASGTVGIAYGVGLAAGCLLAVAWVRRRELFAPMVQPPLLVAVLVPAVVAATGSLPTTGGTVSLVLAVGGPFINGFPAMAVTTAACLAFGWARTRLQPWSRQAPVERSGTARQAAGPDRPGADPGGTDRPGTDRGGDPGPDDARRTNRISDTDPDVDDPRRTPWPDLRTDRLEPDRRERGRPVRPDRPVVRADSERGPDRPPDPRERPDPRGANRWPPPSSPAQPPQPPPPDDQAARRVPLRVPPPDDADPAGRPGPVPTGRSGREDEARRRIREQRMREQRMRSERRREIEGRGEVGGRADLEGREGPDGPPREERDPRRGGPVPPN